MDPAVTAAVAEAHRRDWGFVLAATNRITGHGPPGGDGVAAGDDVLQVFYQVGEGCLEARDLLLEAGQRRFMAGRRVVVGQARVGELVDRRLSAARNACSKRVMISMLPGEAISGIVRSLRFGESGGDGDADRMGVGAGPAGSGGDAGGGHRGERGEDDARPQGRAEADVHGYLHGAGSGHDCASFLLVVWSGWSCRRPRSG